MFSFAIFILWIISAVALVIEFSVMWLVIFVITLIYLIVRGIIFIGISFDLDDLF